MGSTCMGSWGTTGLRDPQVTPQNHAHPSTIAGSKIVPSGQKKSPASSLNEAGHRPGGDLLSQDLSSHYHRRCSVSLPGSEWDRVVPPRSGHQRRRFASQVPNLKVPSSKPSPRGPDPALETPPLVALACRMFVCMCHADQTSFFMTTGGAFHTSH